MLTIQERSCKTTATRFLTIFDKKHNKCKFKSRLLGHSKGGRKNTYTSTYTRVGSTYHIWSWSEHIYPICSSKISFKYAKLMKFDRQIEHHKNFKKVLVFSNINIFLLKSAFLGISVKFFKIRLFGKNTVTFERKTQISLSATRMKLSID